MVCEIYHNKAVQREHEGEKKFMSSMIQSGVSIISTL